MTLQLYKSVKFLYTHNKTSKYESIDIPYNETFGTSMVREEAQTIKALAK